MDSMRLKFPFNLLFNEKTFLSTVALRTGGTSGDKVKVDPGEE